jgi:hypothetical protein
MDLSIRSIRAFLGARDFSVSRAFYREIGFTEKELEPGFSLFHSGAFSFYLQDAYVEDWINNSMIFLEVNDVDKTLQDFLALDLPGKFKGARISPVRAFDWGKEFYLHDPSGILWHIGAFK